MDQPGDMGYRATAVKEVILKAEIGQASDIENEVRVGYLTTGLGLGGAET